MYDVLIYARTNPPPPPCPPAELALEEMLAEKSPKLNEADWLWDWAGPPPCPPLEAELPAKDEAAE